MEDRYVLAIDMGSGSTKAALVSNQGEVVALALRPTRTILLPGGGAEQNPDEWWTAVIAAAKGALAQASVDSSRIVAVACTTLWAVTVPVDQQGNALANAVTWMDTRGGDWVRAIVDGWPRIQGYGLLKLRKWLQLTGGAPVRSGVDGLGHIGYFKQQRPEIFARTSKFLEPMDYLNLRLCGRAAASYGTIFPYWLTDNRDARRIDYHPELLRMAGIDRGKLPDLLPVDAVLGTLQPEVARELDLPSATQVVMGTCDGHAATLGAGCVADRDGYFYVGTTAWLSCHVSRKKTDLAHMLYTAPAALPGRYMIGAEQGHAGRCLEWLKDSLLFPGQNSAAADDGYRILNDEAAAVPAGSDGLIFTPWINGVLAPHEDPSTRSAFFNQTAHTTRGHYARAVMEGVAYNLRWLKGHVEHFIGRRFPQLNFIGGAAVSGLWCQILADILGCPVRQVAEPRSANAVGAALAAFSALGQIRAADIPRIIKIRATYDPSESNRLIYDQHFREFLECYRRLQPVYRRLNPVRF